MVQLTFDVEDGTQFEGEKVEKLVIYSRRRRRGSSDPGKSPRIPSRQSRSENPCTIELNLLMSCHINMV